MTFTATDLVSRLETGTVSGSPALFLACDNSGTYQFISDGRTGVVQYLSDDTPDCGDAITQVAHGTVKEGSKSTMKLELSETRNDNSPAVATCSGTLKR
jgi:hypothetical protein